MSNEHCYSVVHASHRPLTYIRYQDYIKHMCTEIALDKPSTLAILAGWTAGGEDKGKSD